MARPGALQFLKRGLLLSGKAFPRFVETYNWLVRAFDSLVGDGDINPQQGYITIDRTNQDRPVIRFNAAKINHAGSSGTVAPGRFSVEGGVLTNCIYRVGGKSYQLSSSYPLQDGIMALVIDATGSTPSASVVTYVDFSALSAAEANRAYYVCPLYTVSAGSVTIDWRVGPDATMAEF